jgi:hypothetical protein
MRHLPAAAIAVAATLLLTACAAATLPPSHPPAGQCAQARAAARQLALIPSHFTAVATPRSLTAADKRLAATDQQFAKFSSIVRARRQALPANRSGSTSVTFESELVPNVKSAPLSRELQRIEADYQTFWAAWAWAGTTSSHPAASARAVGTAARTTIRDIHVITTTCPEH